MTTGIARICNGGAKTRERSDRVGGGCGGGGGCPTPMVRRYFFRVSKLHFFFFLHIKFHHYRGGRLYVKWHIPTPTSPFYFFHSNQEGGGEAWAFVPLTMPVPVVQLGFVNLGSKRGSEATE